MPEIVPLKLDENRYGVPFPYLKELSRCTAIPYGMDSRWRGVSKCDEDQSPAIRASATECASAGRLSSSSAASPCGPRRRCTRSPPTERSRLPTASR